MPLALIIIGLMLVISGGRDTHADLFKTMSGDFTGPNNFTYRAGAIGMIGIIGLAGPDFKKLSTAMLVLMTLGLLLSVDSGFFAKLAQALAAGPTKPVVAAATPAPAAGATPTADAFNNALTVLKWGGILLGL